MDHLQKQEEMDYGDSSDIDLDIFKASLEEEQRGQGDRIVIDSRTGNGGAGRGD